MATFRKLKSGKWQARVLKDGEQMSIGTFRTKKEAQIEAAAVEERIYYGHTLNDKHKLFEELTHEWLFTHKKNSLKESTFVQYQTILKVHILPYFGSKKVAKIKRIDIKNWLNEYAEMKNDDGQESYSYGARLKYLSVLKSIFHYATHDLEILEKDPSVKLKIPVKEKAAIEKNVKYFSLDELNTLLGYMEQYKHQRFREYRLYFMLMYFLSQTGLRISEALALRWDDIEGNKLLVDKQTSRGNDNRVIITSLKNSSSYREIQLNEELIRELKKFKLIQNEMSLKHPSFKKNKEGIIFQNGFGDYLTPSIVRESIKNYCEKANVDYKGTHGFRHTHAVLLLEAGASIKYVSKRLGHKSIKTTADTYLDITQKIEEDELKKFASYTKRKY